MADPVTGEKISATIPDWSREYGQSWRWNPPLALLKSIRDYQRLRDGGLLAKSRAGVAVFRHRFWSAVTGADIPLNCQIGGGLMIPHPNGIVIFPGSKIGPNCILFQQVTIGANGHGYPTIGGHVDIGAGAKIIGPVTVGDHARIGANAVVVSDIPAGATAVGIPARVIED